MSEVLNLLPDSMLATAARLRAEMIRALPANSKSTMLALENIDRSIAWAERALSDGADRVSTRRDYLDELDDPKETLSTMLGASCMEEQ